MVWLGYMLVLLGLIYEAVALAVSVGWLQSKPHAAMAAGWADVLIALIDRSWRAAVGLVLIYFGLQVLGVSLP
jgi:hypothetical protein